jgi:hypothetical protein
MRPTPLRLPAPAMPATTVQKMMGPTIMRTSLMKPSPSGFRAVPASGNAAPTATPMIVATSTCP